MTHDEIKTAWNVQADKYNQWDSLSEDEKLNGHSTWLSNITQNS